MPEPGPKPVSPALRAAEKKNPLAAMSRAERQAASKKGVATRAKNIKAARAAQLTERDEAEALRVLRKQMSSADEKISQNAALRVLEWRKGRPAQAQAEQKDVRIVYETRALPVTASTEAD